MNPLPPFHLALSERVRQEIRVLVLRASRKGLLGQLYASLHEMNAKLTDDPEQWGDPVSSYRLMGLQLYRRALGPIHVVYAVDAHRRVVYPRNVLPFPGGGFESVP